MKIAILKYNFGILNILEFLVLSIPILLITGPFLPDLFLSISIILFLILLLKKKKLNFLKNKFFYIFLSFFFILILSSLFSDHRSKSLLTSLGYIRFGIFIFVIGYLINEKKDFIKKTAFILLSIFFILFLDAIFQKIFGYNIFGIQSPYGRITSLFGEDIKLGGYIFRMTPLLVALLICLKSKRYIIFTILIISLFLTLISGERTSFIMMLFFLIGYLIFNNSPKRLKIFILMVPLFLFCSLLFNQEFKDRVLTSTLNQINLTNEKPFYKTVERKDGNLIILHRDSTNFPRIYHMYFETAIKIFKDNILIGSGPRTYKFKSKEKRYLTVSDHVGWIEFVKKHNKKKLEELLQHHNMQIEKILKYDEYKELKNNKELINNPKYKKWLDGHGISNIDFNERIKDRNWLKGMGVLDEQQPGFTNISGANNHPHNTYLQLLSETGILGSLIVTSIWFLFVCKLFTKIDLYYKCLILGIIINLFPLFFVGNFFNNWLSILYFYPIGFLLKQNTKY